MLFQYARNVFNTIEAVYVHFSHPSINSKLVLLQESLKINKNSLMQVSDTRWICRFRNCQSIINNYEAIIQILREEIDLNDNKNVAQAVGMNKYPIKIKYILFIICIVINIVYLFFVNHNFIQNSFFPGILATLQKGPFIIYLFILHQVLVIINVLSNQLQQKSATLGNTATTVVGVIKAFEQKRCGEEFTKLWLEIQSFANKHSISLVIPSQGMTSVNIIFLK